MVSSRKYKTTGFKEKDRITHCKGCRQSFVLDRVSFPFSPSPTGTDDGCLNTVACTTKQEHWTWRIRCFRSELAVCLKTLLHLAVLVDATGTEKWLRQRVVRAWHSWATQQEYAGTLGVHGRLLLPTALTLCRGNLTTSNKTAYEFIFWLCNPISKNLLKIQVKKQKNIYVQVYSYRDCL